MHFTNITVGMTKIGYGGSGKNMDPKRPVGKAPGIISSRSSHSCLLIQLPASTSPPFKRIFLTLDGFPVISNQIPGIFHQGTYPCQIFESCLLDSNLVRSESRGPVCCITYSVPTVQERDKIIMGTIILLKEGTMNTNILEK